MLTVNSDIVQEPLFRQSVSCAAVLRDLVRRDDRKNLDAAERAERLLVKLEKVKN